jgi:hypothetical protein
MSPAASAGQARDPADAASSRRRVGHGWFIEWILQVMVTV